MPKKRYRSWNPDQMVLFPSAMRDALDEGHIVFRIMDVVETLDIRCVTDRMEEKEAQRNFTDPDSRIMKRGGDYLQGYNCQIVVDEVNQIILAEAVSAFFFARREKGRP